jgi:hypothetical protein
LSRGSRASDRSLNGAGDSVQNATVFSIGFSREDFRWGGQISDSTTSEVLVSLNKRFEPDELREMVALQQEFKIFSSKHTLRQSFALLGIVPADRTERQRWYRFLDKLPTYKSDLQGVNGHDRVIKALADAFEASQPIPVYFQVHQASEDNRITVTTGRPIIFSSVNYSVVSIPITPSRVAREQAASAARKRRAERSKK